MSKVLVDRELLERCVELLYLLPESRTIVGVRAILAQPAEVGGVDFGFDDRSVKVSQEAYSIFLDRERYLREDLSTERTRADVAVADANDAERALAAVTAERDRLQRNLNFTEQWYAERFERLTDLGKSAGCWDAMAAIIANGTADPYEPPTYAQQLVRAKHRADVVEAERDQLRAEVETLRKDAERYRWLVASCVNVTSVGGEPVRLTDQLVDAAMAAKEA